MLSVQGASSEEHWSSLLQSVQLSGSAAAFMGGFAPQVPI